VLAADVDDDLLGAVGKAVFDLQLLGDGRSQLRYPGCRRVFPKPTTSTPSAFSCWALAVTAMVAEGGTDCARLLTFMSVSFKILSLSGLDIKDKTSRPVKQISLTLGVRAY